MKHKSTSFTVILCLVLAVICFFIEKYNIQQKKATEEQFQAIETESNTEEPEFLSFQSLQNDSIVMLDPDAFSDKIVNSQEDGIILGCYENSGDTIIPIIFMITGDDLCGVESVTFFYRKVDEDIDLWDVTVNIGGEEYDIVDGLQILSHSVSFVTYPILDGYLMSLD